ncbi:ABC transporter ATP-binding protein [Litoribacillus peritrichatus]
MYALQIKDLEKIYSNGTKALKGISLNVQKGDFFALLGPNGAGKSTTLGIVSSLVNKTAGTVQIMGHDLDTARTQAKMKLGVVPQEFNFNQFEKVFDIVVTQAGYYGISTAVAKERAEKYLKKLGLWEKRSTPSRMLSGGMKRRLMIARALVHEPDVLILDEPTAGVDIELRRSMWAFLQEINEQGITIILTTHYLEEAEALCRNIAIIDHGSILVDCPMRELLGQMNKQTIILDVQDTLPNEVELNGYGVRRIDDHTLEVVVTKDQTLNKLFEQLDRASVNVHSFRNKSNRLEETFVSMLGQQQAS